MKAMNVTGAERAVKKLIPDGIAVHEKLVSKLKDKREQMAE